MIPTAVIVLLMLQPVAKVVETSYLNEGKLLTALLRAIFLPSPPFPMLLAMQYDVKNLGEQH